MLTKLAAPDKLTFSGVLQQIVALINQYGPQAKPYIDALIASSSLPPFAKAMLTAIADIMLSGNIPTPAPTP